MLVQNYLRQNGLVKLSEEFGIAVTEHPAKPLVILNYHQINSPKTHPIVKECRGLVLDDQFKLVARSFPRFFNWGETDEMKNFDFSDFTVKSKEDGSLCLIYYHEGWNGNTRGSFGLDLLEGTALTWRDWFLKAMGVQSWNDLDNILDRSLTYVCEFVSPFNKIVRRYKEPKMYLLTAFRGESELTSIEVDQLSGPFVKPERYDYNSIEQIQEFLTEKTKNDPTFEGVIICDRNFNRWKIKSPTYLSLHRMGGGKRFTAKNILPFVLSGEEDELLTYFPEVKPVLEFYQWQVKKFKTDLLALWESAKGKTDKKEFALTVKDNPFSGILFAAKSKNLDPLTLFIQREDQILKNLKPYAG